MTCPHIWVTFELLDDVLTQECSKCKDKRQQSWDQGTNETSPTSPPLTFPATSEAQSE